MAIADFLRQIISPKLASPLPSEGQANPNRLRDLAVLVTQMERRKRKDLTERQQQRRSEKTSPQVLGESSDNPFEGFITTEVPQEFAPLILSASEQYGVDPRVIASLLFSESGIQAAGPERDNINYDKSGRPISRDRGIAQINDKAFPEVTAEQAYNPEFAIPFAAKQIATQMKYFGDLSKAIRAYNAGRRGVEEYGGGNEYLQKVVGGLSPELIRELNLVQ